MIKKSNTNSIFNLKKIVFTQLVLGTFMVGTAYADNGNARGVLESQALKSSTGTTIAFEKITGTVVDEQGNTLPGVNVMKKGSTTGVSTDMDGNFTIDANKGEILIFSYIGFLNQEVQIRDNKILKITLKSEAMQMNEVVVVGYGSQKRTNLTGSVTQIDAKVLKDRPITRLSQGLQGAIGGLNIISNGGAPNATQSINIRGFTGLGSAGSPLIVIDGIQGGDINSINANDVESISVIKDAAASAVYGSSAPYGVILIKGNL